MDLLGDLTEAYAVPGAGTIIDVIIPDTGLTWINKSTEEQIKAEYPGAVRVNFAAWCAEKAARQDAPVRWDPITEEQYENWLECLPPAAWIGGSFLVGEPSDHHAGTGAPRFQACRYVAGVYEASSRPLTVAEFRTMARAITRGEQATK